MSGSRGSAPTDGRLALLLPCTALAAALAWFVDASPHSRYGFPLDDAWIHRVYASAFAHGQGFAYNPGGPQEAGSTSPLWAIASAPAHWLEPFGTVVVVVAVKAIGVALVVVLLACIAGLGRAAMNSAAAGMIAATVFALEPRLLVSALSGMENALLLVLWIGGALAFVRQKYAASLLCFALAPVTRPEAVLLLPLWLAGRWLLDRSRRPTPAEHLVWLAAWTPTLLWGLFCHATSGHWLPTTFYLKSRSFQLGSGEIARAAEILGQQGFAHLSLFVLGLAAFVGWAVLQRRFEAAALLWYLLLAPLLYAVAVAGSREVLPLGYYWTRWLDPASLTLTIAFCLTVGLAAVRTWDAAAALLSGGRPAAPATWLVLAAGIAALLWLAASTPRFFASMEQVRARFASDTRAIHLLNVQTAVWLRQHTAANARIAVNDAGAIRYVSQRWTLDLVGLNSADVAFHRVPLEQAGIDWLAVFPFFASGSPLLQSFALRQMIEIPQEEYTICPCEGQNRVAILERVTPPIP